MKINLKNYGNLKVKAAGGLNPRLVFVKPPSLEVVDHNDNYTFIIIVMMLFFMMLMIIMLLIMMLMIMMLLIMILLIMMLLIRSWKTDSALEEQKLRRVSPRGLGLLQRRWSINSIIIIVIIIITAIVVIIIIVTFLFNVFVVILSHSLLFSIALIPGVNKKICL